MLNPGTYKVEASLPGGRGKVSKSVKVGAKSASRVDFVLELQNVTKYTILGQNQFHKSTSQPSVVAIVLLSVAGVLLVVIVIMVLYYHKSRHNYNYSKMEFS